MKRTPIDLDRIAAWDNLLTAVQKAARGKRDRAEVRDFLARLDDNLAGLSDAIHGGRMPAGGYRPFVIHDPKRRTIHAASFADRVFHHALMNHVGPVLERALSDASYACRPGKGHHAAVRRVQQHLRRYPWYVQIDIDGYFDAIEHARLLELLDRKFKGDGVYALFERILESYHTEPGRGLPIGALTSQHFANYYLDGLDRLVQEGLQARAYVRYMDDSVWWCETRQQAREQLEQVVEYLREERGLRVKPTWRLQRSEKGITFCGYRILPGAIRLSPRKKRRYGERLAYWENLWQEGMIGDLQLQQAYASVHGITDHADADNWRKQYLKRHPPLEV